MKVACYVHPIVHTLGPNFTYVHFEILAELLTACDETLRLIVC
jgi:hypothetical protein